MLKQHCLALTSFRRTIAHVRSRIDWLSEGDANTGFFHSHARYRKKKNYIAKLKVGDVILTQPEEMAEATWTFYQQLIGTAQQQDHTLDLPPFHRAAHDLQELDSPISEEEVWNVVKGLPLDKAPGPDGFTGRFHKTCWGIIKTDVMAAIGAVHAGDSRALQALNSALLVLIPKSEEASGIGDYRPISLIHSFAKLVTKILANRLAPKLQTLVATNQSAFIRGRCIHDNFSLVQHLARYLHNRKEPRLLVKLDLTKAFDSVSWSFLLELLRHLGFGERWCNLICNLLSTSTTRVLLNGQPGDIIHHR